MNSFYYGLTIFCVFWLFINYSVFTIEFNDNIKSDSSLMKVIVYADLLSQPARAVYSFVKMNIKDHELKEVRLAKLENRSDEYVKINP